MSTNRMIRVNELLKREIAANLLKLLDLTEVDRASVMVSRVETSPDIKYADVFISVFGDDQSKRKALKVAESLRPELQRLINKESSFKYTPRLKFHIDNSIEDGDRILGILAEMKSEHPEWSEEESDEQQIQD